MVPHPVHCTIPLMKVNEGAQDKMSKFIKEHKHCLHNDLCMLAHGADSANPYRGLRRRNKKKKTVWSHLPDNHKQGLEASKVAQQPTHDTSYPAGLTVKWMGKRKL
eukprot:3863113-Ditylum_brightwellii.AAC.1